MHQRAIAAQIRDRDGEIDISGYSHISHTTSKTLSKISCFSKPNSLNSPRPSLDPIAESKTLFRPNNRDR